MGAPLQPGFLPSRRGALIRGRALARARGGAHAHIWMRPLSARLRLRPAWGGRPCVPAPRPRCRLTGGCCRQLQTASSRSYVSSAPAGLSKDEDTGRVHGAKRGNFHEIFNLTENERPLAGRRPGSSPGGVHGGRALACGFAGPARGEAGRPRRGQGGGPPAVDGRPREPCPTCLSPRSWRCQQPPRGQTLP